VAGHLNVRNLLERDPPHVPIFFRVHGTTDTNRALFDVLGRRFVLGFEYELYESEVVA
jgi:hypothetical protein